MGLVWLVTFDGIDSVSSGPPGAPRYTAHVYSVVIDAKSGAYIMAFPIFDITPSAPENNPIPTFDETAAATPLPPSNGIPTIAPTVVVP